MIRSLLLVFLCFSVVTAQFGDIASVVTNILGTGSNAAAAGLVGGTGAADAIGNIGTLYQLAQTALQLTGTGVGILNQASEGRWFSDLTNNIVSNQRDIQDRLLTKGASPDELSSASALLSNKIGGFPLNNLNNGPKRGNNEEITGKELGQIGENFKAPEPEDYEELKSPEPESLIRIDKYALTIPTSSPAPDPEPVTLFPDEETINPFKKGKKTVESFGQPLEPRIEPVQIAGDDYYIDVKNELNSELDTDTPTLPDVEATEASEKKDARNLTGLPKVNDTEKVPNDVNEVIGLIRKSELSDRQIAELLNELLRSRSGLNKAIDQLTNGSPGQMAPKYSTFKPAVQPGRQPTAATDDSDSDLLSLYHAKIFNQVNPKSVSITAKKDNENLKHPERSGTSQWKQGTKYPRRIMPSPSANRTPKPSQSTKQMPQKTVPKSPTMPKLDNNFTPVQQPLKLFTSPTISHWTTELWTPPTMPTPPPDFYNLQSHKNIFQPNLNSPADFLHPQSLTSAPTSVPVSNPSKPSINTLPVTPTKNYYISQYSPLQQQYSNYYPVQQPQPFAYGQTVQQFAPMPLIPILQPQPTTWNQPFHLVK